MKAVVAAITISLLCVSAAVFAQAPAYLVSDINQAPEMVSSDPDSLTRAGDTVYFTADDGTHGRELWRTDGTGTGTQLVKDIHAGRAGGVSSSLTAAGDLVYFVADDGQHGREVWRSDGTEVGTFLLKDIAPGPDSPLFFVAPFGRVVLDRLQPINNDVYFVAASPGFQALDIWRSDGTQSGTAKIYEATDNLRSINLAELNGVLFFSDVPFPFTSDQKAELWRSDGTVGGTERVMGIEPQDFLASTGKHLLFRNAGALWASDGTPDGTIRLGTFPWPGISYPEDFRKKRTAVEVGTTLYFAASGGLWRSNGTVDDAVRIATLEFVTYDLVDLRGIVYFVASTPGTGREIFRSDGTAAGTYAMADISLGPAGSGAREIAVFEGELYFAATSQPEISGTELWRSNGTSMGTHPVATINPGEVGSGPSHFASLDGVLLFSAFDNRTGRELWLTDGSREGTQQVIDVRRGISDARPENLFDLDGTLFFAADDGAHGRELWKSDGSQAGTTLVKDLQPGSASSLNEGVPLYPAEVAGRLFFIAPYTNGKQTVWRSDGTDLGTFAVRSFDLNSTNGIGAAGSRYCLLEHTSSAQRLWATDGTQGGTTILKSFHESATLASSGNLADRAFFSLGGVSADHGVWVTDGTPQGTLQLANAVADHFAPVGDTMFFTKGGLWRSDGTRAGTIRLCASCDATAVSGGLAASGGLLFFSAGNILGRSDGTAGGTGLYYDLGTSILYAGIAPLGDARKAIFAAGGSFWVTDGTAAGSIPLIAYGDSSVLLGAIEGAAFLSAPTLPQANDDELWFTDGTEPGTFPLADINPGTESSSPTLFTRSGSRMFFTARSDATGRELWAVDLDSLPTPPFPTRKATATASATATPSPTDTRRASPTSTPPPSPTPTLVQLPCPGDCDADGSVTIDELILGVNIALGVAQLPRCAAFDVNGDSEVTVDELLLGVNRALDHC